MQWIKQTGKNILDIIFPMRSDARMVSSLQSGDLLQLYEENAFDGIVSLVPFEDSSVRACIHETKFHDNQKAAQLLAQVLQKYIASLPHTQIVVIPIPLSKKRKKERGYNQIQRILMHVPQAQTADLLRKTKETVPQTTLARSKRLQNVRGVFALKNQHHALRTISGKHVVLLDDVTTTGATLREAKKALTPLNAASITCVALAH